MEMARGKSAAERALFTAESRTSVRCFEVQYRAGSPRDPVMGRGPAIKFLEFQAFW